MSDQPMHLLLLCGSLRVGSVNEAVLRTAQKLAHAEAPMTTTYFGGLAALPPFNPDDDHEPLPDAVVELREAIRDADALLICTPEYAGDMPGAFKNLLDWTVGGVETEGKPAAWINASSSPMGASGTHAMLRVVLEYTGCTIVDDACVHISVPRTEIHEGLVADPALRADILAVLHALHAFVTNAAAGGTR